MVCAGREMTDASKNTRVKKNNFMGKNGLGF
jgi:hypothetical protein